MYGDDGVRLRFLDDLFSLLHIPPLVAVRGETVQPAVVFAGKHDAKTRVGKERFQFFDDFQIDLALLYLARAAHDARVDPSVPRVQNDGEGFRRHTRRGDARQTKSEYEDRRQRDGERGDRAPFPNEHTLLYARAARKMTDETARLCRFCGAGDFVPRSVYISGSVEI